jgi:hypothetical protein
MSFWHVNFIKIIIVLMTSLWCYFDTTLILLWYIILIPFRYYYNIIIAISISKLIWLLYNVILTLILQSSFWCHVHVKFHNYFNIIMMLYPSLIPKGRRPFFGLFLEFGQPIVDAIFVQKISNFWWTCGLVRTSRHTNFYKILISGSAIMPQKQNYFELRAALGS